MDGTDTISTGALITHIQNHGGITYHNNIDFSAATTCNKNSGANPTFPRN